MLSLIRHLAHDTLRKERERLVLWLPVLLAIGIGLFFVWPQDPSLTASGLVFGLCCVLCFAVRKRYVARMLAISLALVAAGFFLAAFRTQIVAAPVLTRGLFYKEVQGTVEDIQDKAKGGQRFILTHLTIEELPAENTPAKASVSMKKPANGIAVGDKVRVKAMLFPPPTPVVPGGYDFARQFYFDRLGAVGFAPGAPEIIQKSEPSSFEEWLNALRIDLNNRIIAPMSPENGPVASAMMVGEMTAVSKDVADSMRESGIYHVLSISGLHMSIAAALVYITMRYLLALYPPLSMRLPAKKIAAFVGLLSSGAYLLVAGYPVPAIRSFVMVACVMLAVMLDRRGISLYSLAWSAVLILLFQPEALLGASFQLSYAATVAIVAFYERCSHLLYQGDAGLMRRLRLYLLGLVLTSFVATAATTPFVIYHFNRFTIWGIAANMLMIPLASFWLMPAAVLAFLAMPFHLETLPLIWLDKGISLMLEGSRYIASLPLAAISVPPPTFLGLLSVILGGLWLCIWRTRLSLVGVLLVALGCATVLQHVPYDALVSDDATKVAVRSERGELIFLRGKPGGFDGQAWARVSGQDEALKLSDVDDDDAPSCTKIRCDADINGVHIVVQKKKKERDGLCDPVSGKLPDIVIAQDYLDRLPECANIPYLIDKAFLQRAGAVGIRIKDAHVQLETANEFRCQRIWVK